MLITVSGLAEDTSMTVMSVSVSNSVLSVCVFVVRISGLRVAAHEGLVQPGTDPCVFVFHEQVMISSTVLVFYEFSCACSARFTLFLFAL